MSSPSRSTNPAWHSSSPAWCAKISRYSPPPRRRRRHHGQHAPQRLPGRVRVFFPDPWPKAHHHKRRLLQPGTFELIASVLKPGGILHIATDHADYAEFIEETGDACPELIRRKEDSPPPHP
ncbi:MAG: hypothetical protein U1U88_001574 [Lawsonella clevelandensis]